MLEHPEDTDLPPPDPGGGAPLPAFVVYQQIGHVDDRGAHTVAQGAIHVVVHPEGAEALLRRVGPEKYCLLQVIAWSAHLDVEGRLAAPLSNDELAAITGMSRTRVKNHMRCPARRREKLEGRGERADGLLDTGLVTRHRLRSDKDGSWGASIVRLSSQLYVAGGPAGLAGRPHRTAVQHPPVQYPQVGMRPVDIRPEPTSGDRIPTGRIPTGRDATSGSDLQVRATGRNATGGYPADMHVADVADEQQQAPSRPTGEQRQPALARRLLAIQFASPSGWLAEHPDRLDLVEACLEHLEDPTVAPKRNPAGWLRSMVEQETWPPPPSAAPARPVSPPRLEPGPAPQGAPSGRRDVVEMQEDGTLRLVEPSAPDASDGPVSEPDPEAELMQQLAELPEEVRARLEAGVSAQLAELPAAQHLRPGGPAWRGVRRDLLSVQVAQWRDS